MCDREIAASTPLNAHVKLDKSLIVCNNHHFSSSQMESWQNIELLRQWFERLRATNAYVDPIYLTSDRRFGLECTPSMEIGGRYGSQVSYDNYSEDVMHEGDVQEVVAREMGR